MKTPKVGDKFWIEVWGHWRRSHPVPDACYFVEVVEVRRRWAIVKYVHTGREWFRCLRFSVINPHRTYRVHRSDFISVPWNRRDLAMKNGKKCNTSSQ